MPRSMQTQGYTSGQTTVSDGDFGSRFGWYVDNLNRKMASSWYKPEVDPHTPRGTSAYIQFAIHRDGSCEQCADEPTQWKFRLWTEPACALRSAWTPLARCPRNTTKTH
jgi:hypothetical protein